MRIFLLIVAAFVGFVVGQHSDDFVSLHPQKAPATVQDHSGNEGSRQPVVVVPDDSLDVGEGGIPDQISTDRVITQDLPTYPMDPPVFETADSRGAEDFDSSPRDPTDEDVTRISLTTEQKLNETLKLLGR